MDWHVFCVFGASYFSLAASARWAALEARMARSTRPSRTSFRVLAGSWDVQTKAIGEGGFGTVHLCTHITTGLYRMKFGLIPQSRARIQEASPSHTALTVWLQCSDHALWSYSKPQGARTTSSGGAQRLCILRRYPYPVYGTAGPVGGGPSA